MFICGQALQIYNKFKLERRETLSSKHKTKRLSTNMETSLLFRIENDVYTIHVEKDVDEVMPKEDSACDIFVPMSLLAM